MSTQSKWTIEESQARGRQAKHTVDGNNETNAHFMSFFVFLFHFIYNLGHPDLQQRLSHRIHYTSVYISWSFVILLVSVYLPTRILLQLTIALQTDSLFLHHTLFTMTLVVVWSSSLSLSVVLALM